MKMKFLLVIALVVAGGWLASSAYHAAPEMPAMKPPAAPPMAASFQCPMHPWVSAATPSTCSICGMKLVAVRGTMTAENFDPSEVTVDLAPSGPNVLGIATAEVKRRPLLRTLRVAGLIGEDESRHRVISAPVEGRIDGLVMTCDGERVTRRQPMATIFSRTLLEEAGDYQRLVTNGGAGLDTTRKQLLQHGLVWEQIQAIPDRQEGDLYFGLLAPMSGDIVKVWVHEGQYVEEGDRLFEIADFSKMWFVFNVGETDLPLIHVGQWLTLATPSLPGASLRAQIAFISPNLDEATRTAPVRVGLSNPDRRLKNHAFAEGVLETDAPEVLAVPRSAVLWPAAGPRVYLEEKPGVYAARAVKLGRAGDDCWEVCGGLEPGERVVTTGALLIDSQAQLDRLAAPMPVPNQEQPDQKSRTIAPQEIAGDARAMNKLPP